MAMQFFRNKRNSFFTIVVFGLIILTFIFWGVTGEMGPSTTQLTSVNGEAISYSEFQRLLNRQLEAYGQLFGPGQKLNKNLEDFVRRQVASMLISRKLLAQEARRAGIVVGREDILKELEQIEAFQDPQLKRFSPSIYQMVLEQNGLRPREFEESLKEEIAAKRYQQLLDQSVLSSKLEKETRSTLENTQFDLKSAKFSLDSMKATKELKPTPEELRQYYETHSGEFLTSEKRVLEVARLDTEKFRSEMNITEEEIQKFWEDNVKSSNDSKWEQERARALHLLISDRGTKGQQKIQQILTDLRREKLREDSAEFEAFFRDQVKTQSEDYANAFRGGDLGYFSKGDMVKPFSDAVFNGKNRRLVGPVKTDFGYHLIYILDRTGPEKSLQNRRGEITYELQQRKLDSQLQELQAQIQEKYVGKSNSDIGWLQAQGFVVNQTSPIDRSAREALIPFAVIQKAFEGTPKVWQEAEQFEDSLFLVRSLENVAPQPMSFEEARDQVAQKLQQQKLENLVTSLHQKLLSGEITWAKLSQYGAEMKTEKNVKPFTADQVPGFSNFDPLTREFHSLNPKKTISSPILVENAWVILSAENFKSTGVKPSEATAQAGKDLQTAKSADVLDATLQHLMKKAKIPEDFRKEFGI